MNFFSLHLNAKKRTIYILEVRYYDVLQEVSLGK